MPQLRLAVLTLTAFVTKSLKSQLQQMQMLASTVLEMNDVTTRLLLLIILMTGYLLIMTIAITLTSITPGGVDLHLVASES